nr:hypothetical protein [Streptomyces sp. DSM 41633]
MTNDNDANQVLINAASERAHTYEMAFAKAAVAEPILADRGTPHTDLLRAAALRSLVATGAQMAKKGPTATPAHAQTETRVSDRGGHRSPGRSSLQWRVL